MNTFDLPANSASGEWLIFAAMLLAIGIGVACFVIWAFVFRKSGKKKRKRRGRHHHHTNPTLAQAGGLPPRRDPGEPPKGI